MAESLGELRSLSDDEIVRRHDAKAPLTEMGPQQYREELRHRQLARQTTTLVVLTVVIAILTAANVVLVAWTVL